MNSNNNSFPLAEHPRNKLRQKLSQSWNDSHASSRVRELFNENAFAWWGGGGGFAETVDEHLRGSMKLKYTSGIY